MRRLQIGQEVCQTLSGQMQQQVNPNTGVISTRRDTQGYVAAV
jgi:hypothetical protein